MDNDENNKKTVKGLPIIAAMSLMNNMTDTGLGPVSVLPVLLKDDEDKRLGE